MTLAARFLLAVVGSASLSGCATHYCYPLRIETDGRKEHPNDLTIKYAGKKTTWGAAQRVPDFYNCGPDFPESVTLEWANEHGEQFSKVLPVRQNVPPEFRVVGNRTSRLIFRVTKDDEPQVLFRTKLSEISTKELAHPETSGERAQRLSDEELWQAIQAGDVHRVSAALADGASAIQPWMSDPPYKGATLRAAFGSVRRGAPVAIIDTLLTREPTLLRTRDFLNDSGLWGMGDDLPRIEIARIQLKHGANPNFKAAGREFVKERIVFLAAEKNDIELVRLLLQYGVELDFTLADGTPFRDWVAQSASADIRALLRRTRK
jgi:hypothetical protein